MLNDSKEMERQILLCCFQVRLMNDETLDREQFSSIGDVPDAT
jgi:hypothetical protein